MAYSHSFQDMVVEILIGLEAMKPNMHVVSNFLKYDTEGNIVGMKNSDDAVIHMYNKNEKSLEKLADQDFVRSVAARRNIVLVGDSLGKYPLCAAVLWCSSHLVVNNSFLIA